DGLVLLDHRYHRIEVARQFGRDDVHRLAGHIDREQRDTVGVEVVLDGFHGHSSPMRVQIRSMIVPVPIPAPTHRLMSAVPLPVRSSSSSTVPRIMAPVAPSGCPIAMAPPHTLILSCGMFIACM